jgi:predicted Zn-dependent peptidase
MGFLLPAMTETKLATQRDVVTNERRQRIDNKPYGRAFERLQELIYPEGHPYHHPVIGYVEDIAAADLDDVANFFQRHYAPNNAVLSIAGDFDPDRALSLVKKHFGDIARREVPKFEDTGPLPPQTAERTEVMVDPLAELPAFHIAYPIPTSRSPDHYALELLSIVLGDGESSRLYQKLVKDKQVVQEIDVGTDDRRGPDLFSFWAICAEGHTGKVARALIDKEIAAIADKGVSERELTKAKNRVRASFVLGLQSNMARAMNLGEFELYWGDAALLNDEPAHYLAVTAADVQRVAKQYFPASARTVLDVLPPSAASPAETAPAKESKP